MKVPVEGFSGGDRVDLGIPRPQEDLMKAVFAAGKPTVLVLLNGSAVAINWAAEHVPAIVEAWYPGQAGGAAIADVLFGDYNPAGRLPVTFYKSADQLPPFDDYSMKNRTYRYFTGEPLFPFGFGLSYTTFSYRDLKQTGDKITVEVENTGPIAGEEVAEFYVKSGAVRSLAGFQRVALRAHEHKTVQFALPRKNITEISVGGSQNGSGTIRLELTLTCAQPTKDESKWLLAKVSATSTGESFSILSAPNNPSLAPTSLASPACSAALFR